MSDQSVPSGWRTGCISDIATVNPSVSVSSLDDCCDVSFLTMADVGKNGRILNHQVRQLHQVRVGFTRFEEGDILFAKITPCMEHGKGAFAKNLVNRYGFGSTEFHVLRANEQGIAEFIYHVAQWNDVRTKAIAFFTGSAGQQRVDTTFFSRFSLLIPTLPEQRKIAKILTTVDNLIEKTEALIAKYQSVKQGLMHDLFTRGVDEHGHLRPPYADAPDLYKESELGWIPREWDAEPLEKVSSSLITYGIVQPGPHIPDGIPFVQTKDLTGGFLKKSQMDRTSPEIADSYKRSAIQAGDIVCGIRATVGVIVEIPFDLNGANISRGVARISPKTSHNSRYVLWVMRSRQVQDALQREVKGTTYAEVTLPALRRIPIPIPKRTEQDHIVRAIQASEARIDTEKNALSKYRIIKTALMQDLLTGKVRVKVDAETANV